MQQALRRAAMQNAAFAANRLRTLKPRLEASLARARARERRAHWQADYEAVKVERDALAAALREVYPAVVAKLADLFHRVEAVDADVTRINGSAPAGEKRRLLGVELHARNLDRFTRDQPSIAKSCALPDWTHSSKGAWPPHRRSSDWSSVTPAIHHPGADWHTEIEARNLARRQESERVAVYYEGQQRARDERERPTS
jgi:hypothetical protein